MNSHGNSGRRCLIPCTDLFDILLNTALMSQVSDEMGLPSLPLTAEEDESKKRRASKACSTCHTRKVRCDVLEVGLPCTKCRVNKFECAIKGRRKRRKKGDSTGRGDTDSNSNGPPPPLNRSIPEHSMLYQVPHYPFFRSFSHRGKARIHAQDSDHGVLLPVPARDQSAFSHGGDSARTIDDTQFLKRKGVFELPPKEVLDQCVSVYFQLFHPFFPVLHKPSFLDQYCQSDRDALLHGRGPSLLLLQAIIFTASSVRSRCHIIPLLLLINSDHTWPEYP